VTLLAAEQLGRKGYGFEIKREYVKAFEDELAGKVQRSIFNVQVEQAEKERRKGVTQP